MQIPTLQHRESWLFRRRDLLRLSLAGLLGGSACGWLDRLAWAAGDHPARKRACILLWMSGGPSQLDTFDLKPNHENGGPFGEIETVVPGLRISEHLPKLARHADRLALIRSMKTKEGDHSRATQHLRTGYRAGGPIAYPSLGSLVAKQLGPADAEIPNCVSIAPYRYLSPAAYGPGFLGPTHAPLLIADGVIQRGQTGQTSYDTLLKVPNLGRPDSVDSAHSTARLDLLREMEQDFSVHHRSIALNSRRAAYDKATQMMSSDAVDAFDLDGEPDDLRDAYGRTLFGQGCLLARRLVERGVPFIEVSLNGVSGQNVFGWDTHQNNFESVRLLSEVLDNGWATLMEDLASRGLLESTTILWMGEFGRTPKINNNQGRDHFPNAWTTVLAGGGIAGGQAIGSTSPDGMEVVDQPVGVSDLIATLLTALGIDPMDQNMSNVGRPIRLADPDAEPIERCLS